MTDTPHTPQPEAKAVAVQAEGKVLTAGSATRAGTHGDVAPARYDRDGSLVPSFGTAGTITTGFAGNFDKANAVTIQRDGKILAVGEATFSDATTSKDIGLSRYLAN